jgi:hypothetical protein
VRDLAWRTEQPVVDGLAGEVVGAGHQVGVDAEGEPWIGVAEVFGGFPDQDAAGRHAPAWERTFLHVNDQARRNSS